MIKRFFTSEKPLTHGWLRRMYLLEWVLALVAFVAFFAIVIFEIPSRIKEFFIEKKNKIKNKFKKKEV